MVKYPGIAGNCCAEDGVVGADVVVVPDGVVPADVVVVPDGVVPADVVVVPDGVVPADVVVLDGAGNNVVVLDGAAGGYVVVTDGVGVLDGVVGANDVVLDGAAGANDVVCTNDGDEVVAPCALAAIAATPMTPLNIFLGVNGFILFPILIITSPVFYIFLLI